MSQFLSIIIPAYNEAVRLGNSLDAVIDYMRQNYPQGEVIVVDDGSADDTATLARRTLAGRGKLRTSVISYKSNLGKGCLLRVATSHSFPTPIFRRRLPKHRN